MCENNEAQLHSHAADFDVELEQHNIFKSLVDILEWISPSPWISLETRASGIRQILGSFLQGCVGKHLVFSTCLHTRLS